MTDESTVQPHDKDEADIMPAPQASALGKAEDLTVADKAGTENLVHLEAHKRKRTSGERLFDIGTYGGIALVGNELTSNVIMNTIAKAKDDKPAGRFRTQYESFEKWFVELKDKKFISEKAKKFIPAYISEGRLPFLLVATIGGMFMVPPVKWLEDNKGKVVRKLDGWVHGQKAEQDPQMVEAHKEMDNAPKQTWTSLGQGRVITVVAAAAADATFGWKKSITAKLLKGTKLERFSSLDHIADETAKGVMKLTKIDPIAEAKKYKHWEGTTQNLTWLLTLSTTLTALFYVSSKLLAKKEQRQEQRKESYITAPNASEANALREENVSTSLQSDETRDKETPSPKVNNIIHQSAIAQAQPEAQLS